MDQDEEVARRLSGEPANDQSKPEDHKNSRAQDDEQMAIDNEPLDANRIVKHIMVVGFHHKHGYQVDYCYPPLKPNGPVFSTPSKPISLPDQWKTLPLLCLPDGSHNYDSDAIYFTMPDIQETTDLNDNADESAASEGVKTIFGTACYRQIPADKLLNRTDDMTRVAVQKSVCVLSSKPLFGLIRSKLEMITHAYFEELDFSKVRILKLTYDNLNSLLLRDSVKDNATFLGLSARQLVSHFGCNTLVLFKAMLLEKRILFYKSPVRDLCSTIMSMCSLFTGLLECGGLDFSTCDLHLSPTLLEALKLFTPDETNEGEKNNCDSREDKVFFSPSKDEVVIMSDTRNLSFSDTSPSSKPDLNNSTKLHEFSSEQQLKSTDTSATSDFEVITNPGKIEDNAHEEEEEEEEEKIEGSIVDDPHASKLCRLRPVDCGLPLQIFTRGSFCLPYLSISYLDLLSDVRIRGFVIGATNFLFKQRKEMYDVIVDMEENTLTVNDPNLKRCLALTTEDLRFMDFLTKRVKLESYQKDEFDLIGHEITKWVGGDEWIRYHFRIYILYLLKASLHTNEPNELHELFNTSFVQAWKQSTNNYKIWESANKSHLFGGLQSRHPFSTNAKGLNFTDMKLKLSYAVNSSEKGRMINQTLTGISRWSIWNNIASAASAAATSASNTISSAAAAAAVTSAGSSPASGSTLKSNNHQEDDKR